MSYQDYNTPAGYSGPGPRPSALPKVLIIIAIIAAVIAAAYFGWKSFMASQTSQMMAAMQASLPPAQVVLGTPRAWRVLEQSGSLGLNYNPGGVVTGDFDADGDDELLKIANKGKSTVYEADGTKRWAEISGEEFSLQAVSWDCDRDGVAEVIVPTTLAGVVRDHRGSGTTFRSVNLDGSLPVFRLDGTLAAELAINGGQIDPPLTGDVDGDGHDELLVYDYGTGTGKAKGWLVFGRDGKQTTVIKPRNTSRLETMGMPTFTVCGDIDGDGKADLVYPINKMKALAYANTSIKVKELGYWPSPRTPVCASDLDGDGCTELLASESGYMNPVTGVFTDLIMPVQAGDDYIRLDCATGDFDGDGTVEIAAGSMFATGVIVFTPDGQCTYYEELGSMAFAVVTLKTATQDYLVLQLMDRLLIYP